MKVVVLLAAVAFVAASRAATIQPSDQPLSDAAFVNVTASDFNCRAGAPCTLSSHCNQLSTDPSIECRCICFNGFCADNLFAYSVGGSEECTQLSDCTSAPFPTITSPPCPVPMEDTCGVDVCCSTSSDCCITQGVGVNCRILNGFTGCCEAAIECDAPPDNCGARLSTCCDVDCHCVSRVACASRSSRAAARQTARMTMPIRFQHARPSMTARRSIQARGRATWRLALRPLARATTTQTAAAALARAFCAARRSSRASAQTAAASHNTRVRPPQRRRRRPTHAPRHLRRRWARAGRCALVPTSRAAPIPAAFARAMCPVGSACRIQPHKRRLHHFLRVRGGPARLQLALLRFRNDRLLPVPRGHVYPLNVGDAVEIDKRHALQHTLDQSLARTVDERHRLDHGH